MQTRLDVLENIWDKGNNTFAEHLEARMKSRINLWNTIGITVVIGLLFAGCAPRPSVSPERTLEAKDLSEFIHILETYRDGVLANRAGERLRTQIMTFSFAEGNRVYFCTTSDKPVYAQLVAHPYVSYCTFPEDFEPVLSLNGRVVFVEDTAVKQRALESNYYAIRHFRDVGNPLLRVFYIDVEEIETFSSEGAFVYAAKPAAPEG
jgi:uncharacterized pyridoxamine 5'-phosphate oxidase family protein